MVPAESLLSLKLPSNPSLGRFDKITHVRKRKNGVKLLSNVSDHYLCEFQKHR
jgi:hypothetical protein